MIDFVRVIKTKLNKDDIYQLSVDFNVGDLSDIVVHGGEFGGFYNEQTGFWESKKCFYGYLNDLLNRAADEERALHPDHTIIVQNPTHLSSKVTTKLDALLKAQDNTPVLFNQKIIYSSEEPKKQDYATLKMPYDLAPVDICPCYDALMGVLYSPESRTMLEWLAGAALSGDGGRIDKFCYLEGEPGSGKSTFLNILDAVIGPYGANIKAEAFANMSSSFATAQMKTGPLIGIQHDGDLSHIESNTILNNIISHEPIMVNEKFVRAYYIQTKTVLFIASNEPLRLTSSLSGLLRRALDPTPTGRILPREKYDTYVGGINMELGAIARRFINVYKELGRKAYDKYRSTRIVRNGNALGYWVQRVRDIDWAAANEALLSDEYTLYRVFCDSNSVKPISKCSFERQMSFFWEEQVEEPGPNGSRDVRFMRYGWKVNKFKVPVYSKYLEPVAAPKAESDWLSLTVPSDSEFAEACKEQPAQYASESGYPRAKWEKIETKLQNIVSSELHYVRPPEDHIVIDLDLRGTSGEKDLGLNIEKIRELGLPPTYAELSKSGQGVHLHYIYTGDIRRLTTLIEDNVEIKVFVGNASLRRKFTLGNNLPIATISSGLPEKMSREDAQKDIKDAAHLRNIIRKGLRGEFGAHIVTVKFLDEILKNCYKNNNFQYNLEYMRVDIHRYASESTHHASECSAIVEQMKLVSADYVDDRPIAFFDFEVFKNFNLMCWKIMGSPKIVRERFPSAAFLQQFFRSYRAIGFNNKAYDNDIAWTIMCGATPMEVYTRSKWLIGNKVRVSTNAKNLSYTDIFDFSNTKKSLKEWELIMGSNHKECRYDWDEELPESAWPEVEEYCCCDVENTEKLFSYDKIAADWVTRKSLVRMCNSPKITYNTSTNSISAYLIFGEDRNPQSQFVYTDLSQTFPGYSFYIDENNKCKSTYKGEDPSNGGWVKAQPGYYTSVGCDDVASQHPSSAIALNIFGPKYTERYKDLAEARKACKHPETAAEKLASNQFGDVILEMVNAGEVTFKQMAASLKTPINAVYGETSAPFDNPFKDPRNVDNIVAKRGALMMIDLYLKLLSEGHTPVHIKTDSIKMPNYTREIHEEIYEYGQSLGYTFEIEEFYSVFCLINKAEYIGYNAKDKKWESRGVTFSGYTMKQLFTGEPVEPKDLVITKKVTNGAAMYLGDQFIGKNINVVCTKNGKELLVKRNDKFSAVTGTKGYLWSEYEDISSNEDWEDDINWDYYNGLVSDALSKLEQYVPYDIFMKTAVEIPLPFEF